MNFGFNFGFGGNKGIKALINYLNSGGIFRYTTLPNGNTILKNNGSGGMIYDAQPNTGRALQLGATNELAIDIFHTLGADTKQTATLGTGWTANGSHSYTGSTASSGLSNISTLTLTGSETLEINFEITARTAGTVEGKSALGAYKVYKTVETLVGASFSGTVIINSVKQITNPNSFITYNDVGTNQMVHLGNGVDGVGNSPELIIGNNSTFTNNLGNWYSLLSRSTLSIDSGGMKIAGNGTHEYPNAQIDNIFIINKTYLVSFDVLNINNNNKSIVVVFGESNITVSNIIPPANIKLTTRAVMSSLRIEAQYSLDADEYVIIDNVSIKEVLPLAPTYPLISKTVNNILTTHTEFSASDLTKLQDNQNLLGKLALNGSAAELDMVLTGDEGWYPCAEETRALVFDAKSKSNGTFYFKSAKLTTQTYTLRMPVGTTVTLNGVVYNGAGNTFITATTVGKTVKFTESVDGALTYFGGSANQLTGSMPDLSANTLLSYVYYQSNQLTGSISDLSANTQLIDFYCSANQLTGSVPSLSTNTKLQNCWVHSNQLTGYAGGNIKVAATFNASNNALTVAAVNSILQGLADGGTTGSGVTITLNGGTNGVPTNTAAIDTLRGRGCTVTVNGGY